MPALTDAVNEQADKYQDDKYHSRWNEGIEERINHLASPRRWRKRCAARQQSKDW